MINGTTHCRLFLSPITPPEWTVFFSEVSFGVEKLKNYPYVPQDVSTYEPPEARTMTSPLQQKSQKHKFRKSGF